MAIDRYMRAVLTVIAVCLLWLSVGGPSLIVPVNAQTNRVYITGWIDQDGAYRSCPRPAGQAATEPGKAVTPSPLPIWQWNN